MGQILRIVFFPFIWVYNHEPAITMFCVRFLLAEVALAFIITVGYLIVSFLFGPFTNPLV